MLILVIAQEFIEVKENLKSNLLEEICKFN